MKKIHNVNLKTIYKMKYKEGLVKEILLGIILLST